jgi:hypothetical protein
MSSFPLIRLIDLAIIFRITQIKKETLFYLQGCSFYSEMNFLGSLLKNTLMLFHRFVFGLFFRINHEVLIRCSFVFFFI